MPGLFKFGPFLTAILAITVFLVKKAGAIALSQANRGLSLINVPNKIAILKFNQ